MTLRIFPSLTPLRLTPGAPGLGSSLQRPVGQLSSGIGVAGINDRPADVAIRSALRRDVRIASVAMTNASTGVSMVSLGDSALAETSALLGRMADIAQQSIDEALTSSQRAALQTEFTQIGSQIQNISRTTSFNGVNLLSGGSNVVLQVGLGNGANDSLALSGVQATLQAMGLSNSTSDALVYSINATDSTDAVKAARTALDAVYAAIGQVDQSRASFQAAEGRLEGSIRDLSVARENIAAAESGIGEFGAMKREGEEARKNIIQDAASALLAQGNQQPALVTQLLDPGVSDSGDKQGVSGVSSTRLGGGQPLQRDISQTDLLRTDLRKTDPSKKI
jgi:flagellin